MRTFLWIPVDRLPNHRAPWTRESSVLAIADTASAHEMWRRRQLSIRTTTLVRVGRQCPQARNGVVAPFSSSVDEDAVAASSALRQQLEFCCLVGGWDTPCMTCPFDWRGFDPKERYRILRRTPRGANDAEDAMKILGMATSAALDERAVKAAFRRQALEWHPDCNKDPSAEERFREILDAYELLLAILSSP